MSISDEESKDLTDQSLTIHFVTIQFEEDVHRWYYNQVVMTADDLEILKQTGGNVPQSKRQVLDMIKEKQDGKHLLLKKLFQKREKMKSLKNKSSN